MVGGERDPYRIAYLLFQNLTSSLETSWSYMNVKHEDEFASSTLRNRMGVCRHFARAYAAVCMVQNLPVRTIVGTTFSAGNETYKKNHEWNEVFIPGYGWITVDVTWRQFGLLPKTHMVYTVWQHVGNLTVYTPRQNDSAYLQKSQSALMNLLLAVERKLDDVGSRASQLRYFGSEPPEAIVESRLLLVDSAALIHHQICHDALKKICQAYMSMIRAQESVTQSIRSILVKTIVFLGLLVIIQRERVSRFVVGLANSFARERLSANPCMNFAC